MLAANTRTVKEAVVGSCCTFGEVHLLARTTDLYEAWVIVAEYDLSLREVEVRIWLLNRHHEQD